MERYFGNFSCKEDVIDAFCISSSELDNCEIIYANYDTPPYEGHAQVIFSKENKLFEVNGSHCSCNGLENCWNPIQTSFEALCNLTTTNSKAYENIIKWNEYYDFKETKTSDVFDCESCEFSSSDKNLLVNSGTKKNKKMICRNCDWLINKGKNSK